MREASFIDSEWQTAINLLTAGHSVFLCAPVHYGKKYFFQYLREFVFASKFNIININNISDDDKLNFQQILNQFQDPLVKEYCLLANNQHDFSNALKGIVKENSFLVLISNTFRSYKNISVLVDALHDVVLQYPSTGHKKYLIVLLADDYSLYHHERSISAGASRWYFFKRIYLRQLTDTAEIEKLLLVFFHNRQAVKNIIQIMLNLSGGHQGILREIINFLYSKWSSIDFNKLEDEIKDELYNFKFIDSLRQEISLLPEESLEYLYSFKNKKLIEVHQNEIVKKYHQKGVLLFLDNYIQLIDGVIHDLIKTTLKSKKMGQQKKLILCIHGLNGSEETWTRFKELYSYDMVLKEEYDFATYVFPTSMKWNFKFWKAKDPAIHQLASGLRAEIEFRYSDYDEVALVCHSLGGLVGRKYLLEQYLEMKFNKSPKPSKPEIKKIIMYATPHNGASLADAARHITIRNDQVKQLCRNSDFLQELNDKWMKSGANDHYKSWFIIGGIDQVVDRNSAEMFWGNTRCKMVIDADHFTIVKPVNDQSMSYIIFRKTLLEDI